MGAPARYAVPWDIVFGLTRHIVNGTQQSVDAFSAGVAGRILPAPLVNGLEHLPENPRFVLAANHYQRKGCWILHPASVLTQAIRQRYGPGDPPVRWIVTANWPPIRIGRWQLASPGDVLLPKVAHALCCYAVSFAGNNPAYTASSLRRILRDARSADRPIGIFPEGVGGSAGILSPPLPGVDRLLRHLAKAGLPVVPAGIWEDDRFRFLFGSPIPASDLTAATDPAALVMERIGRLLRVKK